MNHSAINLEKLIRQIKNKDGNKKKKSKSQLFAIKKK